MVICKIHQAKQNTPTLAFHCYYNSSLPVNPVETKFQETALGLLLYCSVPQGTQIAACQNF